MYELLAWSLLLAAALVATTVGWHRRARARQERLRGEGWRLIHELKAYGAWLESLRGECALAAESGDEARAGAQALRSAGAITRHEFPALAQASARLVQGDSRLVALLWQRKVHREADAAAGAPVRVDLGYRELLEDQLDLVEELIARCQVLIGDRDAVWRGTDMDPDYAGSFGLSTISTR